MNIKNYVISNIKEKIQKYFIAGPCSFSSYEELKEIAMNLKELGIEYMRAGAFKPRTSPYSFQGLQDEGIDILKKVKKEVGIKIVSELMSIEQVKKYSKDIDIIQIGARNMYNYELLKFVGKQNKPVLLKRHFSATIEEWLNSAEYIAKEGNTNIILCERGIRSFDAETRNVLDLQAVAIVKKYTNLPVIVDPSHAAGRRDIIEPMCRASLACGADGLIIEAHINPNKSISDSNQTIDFITLKKIYFFYKNNNK